MREPGFNTKAIHGNNSKLDVHRAIRFPVYAGVAYDFESAEDIEGAFKGTKPAHAYSRSSNPKAAHFQSLGLETLSLRVEKGCANTLSVAEFLEQRQDVTAVLYPGLKSSPFHEIAQKQFQGHGPTHPAVSRN